MIKVSAVLVVVLAALAPPAVAAELPVRVVTYGAENVWKGDGTTAVFTATWTTDPVTRTDDGRQRRVAAVGGCNFAAAGGGRLAYECGRDQLEGGTYVRHLATASLAGGDVARVDATSMSVGGDGAVLGLPERVGARWIFAFGVSKGGSEFGQYVNWRTGEVREAAPWGVRQREELDARSPMVPLCRPLKLQLVPNAESRSLSQVYPVTVNGQWALIWRGADRAALHRCGRRAPVVLPKGMTTPTLGQGWVAQAREVKNTGWSVDLMRLADRRRFVVRSMTRDLRDRPQLVLTRGRLYMRDHGGMLVTVRLPKV